MSSWLGTLGPTFTLPLLQGVGMLKLALSQGACQKNPFTRGIDSHLQTSFYKGFGGITSNPFARDVASYTHKHPFTRVQA